MPKKTYLIYGSILICFALILALAFAIIFINKNNSPQNSSTLSPSESNPEKIIINDKEISNPTFDNLGFYMKQKNQQYHLLVKLLSVDSKENKVTAEVQLGPNTSQKAKVLFYGPNLIHSLLVNNVPDNFIYSVNQIQSKSYKGKEEISKLLNNYKTKNILLVLYTKEDGPEIKPFIDCNKKELSRLENKNDDALECTLAAWDIYVTNE